jgi:hypothetical protein
MKNGLSKTAKWSIALVALLALAMGVNGAASASRSSGVAMDSHTFANTVLLQDGINTISMLQATATPAPTQAQQTPAATQAQQTPAATQAPQATPAPQTGGTGTTSNNNGLDIATLPNGYFIYTGYLNNFEGGKFIVNGQSFNKETQSQSNIDLRSGQLVRITGIVRGDGTMLARTIEVLNNKNQGASQAGVSQSGNTQSGSTQSGNNQSGNSQTGNSQSLDFLFSGRLESNNGNYWKIGNVPVRVSDNLMNRDSLKNGERVVVAGVINGNTWVATSITPMANWSAQSVNSQSGSQSGSSQSGNSQSGNNQAGSNQNNSQNWLNSQFGKNNNQSVGQFFYFRGTVDKNNPLSISGIDLRLSDQFSRSNQNSSSGNSNSSSNNTVASWLRPGDEVAVRGAIDENGVWRADSIRLIGRQMSTLFIVGVLEKNSNSSGDNGNLTIRGLNFETNSASRMLGTMRPGQRVEILATPISGNRWMIIRAGVIGLNPKTTNFGALASLQGKEGQITICHMPGGTAANQYTMKVNVRKARLMIMEGTASLGECK